MKTRLLSGLDKSDHDEFKQSFIQGRVFRKRLTHILMKDVESLQTSMRDEDAFLSPNWAYLQADKVAQTKVLLRVINLLNEENENK